MVSTEFFDIFGLMAFIIILFISVWMVKSKRKILNRIGIILLLISVIGIIIDGFIVIKTYLLKG